MLDTFERIQNMSYREDELDAAIEQYIEALDIDALESYVRNDMQTAYNNADSETVDEFIAQMNGEW